MWNSPKAVPATAWIFSLALWAEVIYWTLSLSTWTQVIVKVITSKLEDIALYNIIKLHGKLKTASQQRLWQPTSRYKNTSKSLMACKFSTKVKNITTIVAYTFISWSSTKFTCNPWQIWEEFSHNVRWKLSYHIHWTVSNNAVDDISNIECFRRSNGFPEISIQTQCNISQNTNAAHAQH